MSSGRTRTKAERRAAGWRRLDLLISPETARRLDDLCADSGMSKADLIRALVDQGWAERKEQQV